MPDLSIFCSNLKRKLFPGERVIADVGYRGDPKVPDPDGYRRDKNNCAIKEIGKLRARHKKIYGCFKTLVLLRQIWHNSDEKNAQQARESIYVTHLDIEIRRYNFHDDGYADSVKC